MLIELEQDGTGLGVVSRPVLVNSMSVACVRQGGSSPHPPRTVIVFTDGHELWVRGECEDIGRQIQEALDPPKIVAETDDRDDIADAFKASGSVEVPSQPGARGGSVQKG